MKKKETIDLEKSLEKDTLKKRIYGCEEITIGFFNAGKGNEIVDFMTMDSKGIIKCYEIKVTLQDLKSNAKKSWYGHYNYLVVTKELYDSISDWNQYIPNHVGIIVGTSLISKRKAQKHVLDVETETMLKESMVRSIYWKMIKYKDSQSIEKQKILNQKIRQTAKDVEIYKERALRAESIINDYENYKWANDGIEINLENLAKQEKHKYFENRRKKHC